MSLDIAKNRLEQGGYTCVLTNGTDFFTSTERGVLPLVRFIEQGSLPRGLCGADKVVGKATAYLYVILGVKRLYAAIISKPALALLSEYGISVEYGLLVPNIINRKGDGICPFEEAVLSEKEPHLAYRVILEKMKELNINL